MKEAATKATKPDYPYKRIEGERRERFIEEYKPSMSEPEIFRLTEKVSYKDSRNSEADLAERDSEESFEYVRGFVLALTRKGDCDDYYQSRSMHKSLGYINGVNTRKELESA